MVSVCCVRSKNSTRIMLNIQTFQNNHTVTSLAINSRAISAISVPVSLPATPSSCTLYQDVNLFIEYFDGLIMFPIYIPFICNSDISLTPRKSQCDQTQPLRARFQYFLFMRQNPFRPDANMCATAVMSVQSLIDSIIDVVDQRSTQYRVVDGMNVLRSR